MRRYAPRYGPGNTRPTPCGPDPLDNWTEESAVRWTRRIDDDHIAIIRRQQTHLYFLSVEGPNADQIMYRRQRNFKHLRQAVQITEKGTQYKRGIKFD